MPKNEKDVLRSFAALGKAVGLPQLAKAEISPVEKEEAAPQLPQNFDGLAESEFARSNLAELLIAYQRQQPPITSVAQVYRALLSKRELRQWANIPKQDVYLFFIGRITIAFATPAKQNQPFEIGYSRIAIAMAAVGGLKAIDAYRGHVENLRKAHRLSAKRPTMLTTKRGRQSNGEPPWK